MNPTSFKMWRLFLVAVCVFCSFSPASYFVLREEGNRLAKYGITSISSNTTLYSHLTNEKFGELDLRIEFNGQQVIIRMNDPWNSSLWKSPPEWQVREAFFSDLNRDGYQELSLLVWREYRPWPVEQLLRFASPIQDYHNKEGQSCQLILLKWDGMSFKEAWAGSALAAPIHNLQVLDIDGDGFQELAALEQPYDAMSSGSSVVVWRWNGFGFSLDTRLSGRYTNIWTLYDQERAWLVVR